MPEMHLRQPGFTSSACGQFAKNKERRKKFKETGDSKYIYQKKLDKAWFQHDMACGDFKDLNRRTANDKVLCDKAFNINERERRLALMVYKFLIKKPLVVVLKMKILLIAEELRKPITRKSNKRKVHSLFIDNIWGADLADMQLISKFKKGFRILLCVIYS